MYREIEAKFRVDDHEPVRGSLRAFGATLLESVLETNHLLDLPEGSLRNAGCGLRVRLIEPRTNADNLPGARTTVRVCEQRRVSLTFKGPRDSGPFKSREEIETMVEDADAVLMILERLGFQTVLWYQKRRESWQLGPCRVELDEPPRLGLFVEIEGPSETAIRETQQRLRLTDDALIHASYVRLIAEYCTSHGVLPARLGFDG